MIRQLDALSKIMMETTKAGQRRPLLEQAAMIQRSSERSVPEESDRADVRRAYETVLTVETRLAERQQPPAPLGVRQPPGS
jgi:uncharacterized membrane protein